MAATADQVVVELKTKIDTFLRDTKRAGDQFDSQTKRMSNSASRMARQISTSTSTIKTAFAALGAAFTYQNYQKLTDEYTTIQNALKATGLAGDDLAKTYSDLYQAAQRNSAPVSSLVQLYSRLSITQKELNTSSSEIVQFSDTISQVLRATGTSSQEASGALLQLSQSLGSGTVRAEEFNSILEGAPGILRAAAAGLKEANGSVSELRKLMLDGKLSSEALFRAIMAGAGDVTQNLGSTNRTIAQSMTGLYNSLVNAVGKFNESSQAANTFGKSLDGLATSIDNFDMTGAISEVNNFIGTLRSGVEEVIKFSDTMSEWARKKSKDWGTDRVGEYLGGSGVLSYIGAESNSQRAARLEKENGKQSWRTQGSADGQEYVDGLEQSIVAAYKPKYPKGVADYLASQNTTVITASSPNKPANSQQKPVSIADYPAMGTGKTGKGAKEKEDEYQRLNKSIYEQIDALNAQATAQSNLNPFINDFGYAVEKARIQQELLTAAKKANIPIDKDTTAAIDDLSTKYASAYASLAKLSAGQEEMRQKLEAVKDVSRDVTRTFVDGMIQGKSAAEALGDAVSRLGQRFLDAGLDQLFNGLFSGGLGGLFGGGQSLFSRYGSGVGLYDSGGYTGAGGKYEPAGIVHKGEVVWSQDDVKRWGGAKAVDAMRRGYANGGIGGQPSIPAIPRIPSPSDLRPKPNQVAVNSNVRVGVDQDGNLQAYVAKVAQENTAKGIQRFAGSRELQQIAWAQANKRASDKFGRP
ncbi:tape measure protein [Bartonella sp. LJL80]